MTYAGYSTSPELDASRYYDSLAAWQKRQAQAEQQCAEDFLRMCATPNDAALFARRRNGTCPPMYEEFFDALYYSDFQTKVMHALVRAAQTDAETQELLNDIARDYAARNVEVD